MLRPILQSGAPGGPELLILLLTIVVPLAISYYIYRDAKRRGSRHALAWGLGAFFGSLVVWLLYFVVRDEVGRGGRA
ncbi:hypothetical protein [Salinigranum sp. GCM10025319]|uniref:hypothetical protein n=1 Tax=Salinigranum sp. GCM10025319 TaxID=3252687 RepID=UPI00360685F8